ncbi:MAG: SPOR domain-containing protein [Pseudomonadota bacterium]
MKERLIGAVVLVLVAWLLIPIFLDSQPDSPADDMTTRTVSLPGVDASGDGQQTQTRTIQLRPREGVVEPTESDEPLATLVLPPPQSSQTAETIDQSEPESEQQEARSDESVQASGPMSSGPAVVERSSDASESPVTTAESDNTGSAAQVALSDRARPVDPAELLPAPDSAEAAPPARSTGAAAGLWVVQVGSFGQRTNAENLMQELIAEGFPAFVSEVQSGGRTMHRVRVGPQKDRDAADAVVATLKGKGQTTARSVPYP